MKKKIALLLALVMGMMALLCACGAKKPTAILFKETAVELKIDGQHLLEYTLVPEDAEASELKWQSANEEVVTVDENGNLLGIAPGTATVILSTEDGVMASCEVTVLPPTAYDLLNKYEKAFVDSIGTILLETKKIAQIDNDYTYTVGTEKSNLMYNLEKIRNINVSFINEWAGEQNYDEGFKVFFYLIDKNVGLADDSLMCTYEHNFSENSGRMYLAENTFLNYLDYLDIYSNESAVLDPVKINAALDELWSN